MSQHIGTREASHPWALVTGASAGIGAEFCRQLAAKGYQLVLVARRVDRLNQVAEELKSAYGTTSVVIAADLSKKDAAKSIVKRLAEENIAIECLVNNAGYGLPGSFHVPDWQEHADFIQVMVTAVCELTWHLLPGMQARECGQIINISSVAGLVPSSAGHTLYGASKAFLIKFSESLALENKTHGVKVAVICPGFTFSEFHDVNHTRNVVSQLPGYLWLDAKAVVSDALASMSSEDTGTTVIPGRQYKMIVWINRYLPWLAAIFFKKSAKHYRVTE